MEYNSLVCGDAVSEMTRLPDECVGLVIADPPYNLGKNYGNNRDLKAWDEYENLKSGIDVLSTMNLINSILN